MASWLASQQRPSFVSQPSSSWPPAGIECHRKHILQLTADLFVVHVGDCCLCMPDVRLVRVGEKGEERGRGNKGEGKKKETTSRSVKAEETSPGLRAESNDHSG